MRAIDKPERIKPYEPLIWDNNGKAVKVYRIRGTAEGSGSFDLNNWKIAETLSTVKGQSFDDFVEPMIANYPQDELLYFVLDTFMIHEEENESTNKESKLPIFIALKSLCDAWLEL